MLLSFIIPGLTAKRLSVIQKEVMSRTDARVQKVTEGMCNELTTSRLAYPGFAALQVIRMVKLFGWEHKVNDMLGVKREDELRWVRLREFTQLLIDAVNYTIPVLQMISIFFTFTVIMKRQLTRTPALALRLQRELTVVLASIVFSSIPVFELIRNELHYAFGLVPKMIQGLSLIYSQRAAGLMMLYSQCIAQATRVLPLCRESIILLRSYYTKDPTDRAHRRIHCCIGRRRRTPLPCTA